MVGGEILLITLTTKVLGFVSHSNFCIYSVKSNQLSSYKCYPYYRHIKELLLNHIHILTSLYEYQLVV